MRTMIFGVVMAAVSLPAATVPAFAQSRENVREQRRDVRQAERDCRRDLRDADNSREARRELRDCQDDIREQRRELRQARRDWRQYRNYDYNRYEPGSNGYYADRYYRQGTYYQDRRLGVNDRVYRGQNGRYYCRRPDGTTGLIVGGIAGGILGNIIAPGRSDTLGTILGAIGGGVAGRAIDRNNVRCD